jgi:hypothetical protein
VSPRLTFALVGLLVAATAGAAEIHGAITVAPEFLTENTSSPYYRMSPTVDTPRRDSRQDIELKLQEGGFNAQGILRQQVAQGHSPEYHGIANQFYYDGAIAPGIGWTAGKKVMSWGVGFGFKPLDVIQRENRRSVNPPPLVGVPLVALERFSDNDAWTMAWTRPGQGSGETDERDPSLALHWYRLADGDDLHGVMRISQRRRLEAGVGATRVIGEEWSIYGAALYQGRGPLRPDGSFDSEGIKAVAGAQWTGESGLGVLAEAWDDPDAPPTTGTPRENVLLRLSWDDRDGFKPYAEWLLTPRDDGHVYTVGASWQGDRQRFTLGARQVGGARDSAYAQAPIKRMLWAEWHLALF